MTELDARIRLYAKDASASGLEKAINAVLDLVDEAMTGDKPGWLVAHDIRNKIADELGVIND